MQKLINLAKLEIKLSKRSAWIVKTIIMLIGLSFIAYSLQMFIQYERMKKDHPELFIKK